MTYYPECDGKRPQWRFWRNKSGENFQTGSAVKHSGSRSVLCSRDGGPPARLTNPAFENVSPPGQLMLATNNSSDASSERKGSAASASLKLRCLSTSSIAPAEYTKTIWTSTSAPVVTREMYTDPVAGELVVTVTTTMGDVHH